MEEATRLGQYARTYEAERSTGAGKQSAMETAGHAAAESTIDFRRVGAKGAAVNQIIPFFNPAVQGIDKFFRTIGQHPGRTAARGTLITSISLLLAYANQDDPRVQALPTWQRNFFWVIPSRSTSSAEWAKLSDAERAAFERAHSIWLVPKPFLWGQVFGTVPEVLFDRAIAEHPEAMDRIGNSLVQGFGVGFTPSGITPILENALNYSIWRETGIVPDSLERLDPAEQFTAHTPEVYRRLARAAHVLKDVPLVGQLSSPMKVEHLVEGVGGTLARETAKAADIILEKVGAIPEKPARGVADIPSIGRLAARTPASQSQTLRDFYDLLETERKATATAKQIQKTPGRLQEAVAYRKAHQEEIAKKALLEQTAEQLAELRKGQNRIRESQAGTPESRRERIDQFQERMERVAQSVLVRLGKRKPSVPPERMAQRWQLKRAASAGSQP
jgi:hypothetical protein